MEKAAKFGAGSEFDIGPSSQCTTLSLSHAHTPFNLNRIDVILSFLETGKKDASTGKYSFLVPVF